jgi:hypothetical protein
VGKRRRSIWRHQQTTNVVFPPPPSSPTSPTAASPSPPYTNTDGPPPQRNATSPTTERAPAASTTAHTNPSQRHVVSMTWHVNGLKGDGNISYNQEAGVVIQCSDCGDWSHLACQQDGRASDLPEKELFICNFCDLSTLLPRPVDSRRSLRK